MKIYGKEEKPNSMTIQWMEFVQDVVGIHAQGKSLCEHEKDRKADPIEAILKTYKKNLYFATEKHLKKYLRYWSRQSEILETQWSG